jgi:hypothetical protein
MFRGLGGLGLEGKRFRVRVFVLVLRQEGVQTQEVFRTAGGHQGRHHIRKVDVGSQPCCTKEPKPKTRCQHLHASDGCSWWLFRRDGGCSCRRRRPGSDDITRVVVVVVVVVVAAVSNNNRDRSGQRENTLERGRDKRQVRLFHGHEPCFQG